MTTVVALHTPGKGTLIASDTQLTLGNMKSYYAKGKVVLCNGWAVGVCGSFKTLTLIERHGDELFDRLDDVHEIGDRIAHMTKEYGYSSMSEEGGTPTHDTSMLIASADGVWDLDGSYAEMPVPHGELAACGSGRPWAQGSGDSTQGLVRDPLKRVVAAMKAAMRYDVNTGGEIVIAELRSGKKANV